MLAAGGKPLDVRIAELFEVRRAAYARAPLQSIPPICRSISRPKRRSLLLRSTLQSHGHLPRRARRTGPSGARRRGNSRPARRTRARRWAQVRAGSVNHRFKRRASLWRARGNSIAQAGFDAATIEVAAGEGSKSGATLDRFTIAWSPAQLDHPSVIFALGGGVVGDLAGFAAATYLRGTRGGAGPDHDDRAGRFRSRRQDRHQPSRRAKT